MKKLVIAVVAAAALVIGVNARCFASDWDKAGKALAIIEGVRVITGGQVDVIGTITGINRPRGENRDRKEYARGGRDRDFGRPRYAYERRPYVKQCEMIWVPHYVWVEKYIPKHTEHRPGYREVVVQAHYEKYQVEQGGHWEEVYR